MRKQLKASRKAGSGNSNSNPNSTNQRWAKWTMSIVPPALHRMPTLADVKFNAAKFGRTVFGSASAMNVTQCPVRHPRYGTLTPGFVIEVLTEGESIHNPQYRERMIRTWLEKFFVPGFGVGVHVDFNTKAMAGERSDGKPPDQMVVMPSFKELIASELGETAQERAH
jgi:hypothetical protein